MIKTFAPDRTDQSFSMSILPWRSPRRRPVTYAALRPLPVDDYEHAEWRLTRVNPFHRLAAEG
jgi:hypothetical protein